MYINPIYYIPEKDLLHLFNLIHQLLHFQQLLQLQVILVAKGFLRFGFGVEAEVALSFPLIPGLECQQNGHAIRRGSICPVEL